MRSSEEALLRVKKWRPFRDGTIRPLSVEIYGIADATTHGACYRRGPSRSSWDIRSDTPVPRLIYNKPCP